MAAQVLASRRPSRLRFSNSITRSCSTASPCAKARGAPDGTAAASGSTTRSGCCEAKASFLMDHGRVGPPGLLGGSPGAVNEITVSQAGVVSSPPHLSKGEGYVLAPGDWIAVKTPGGGGYGPAAERDPALVESDIARGYYTDVEAVRLFTRTHAAAAE